MSSRMVRWLLLVGIACGVGGAVAWRSECLGDEPRPVDSYTARSRQAMVASVHPLATAAGVQALRDGGNAVDAAVAAALTLGVVDGHNSGIGGGTLILIRTPDNRFFAIDGREMAPAKAHRDLYVRDGKLDAEASQTGPLAVAVPGAPAAYAYVVEQWGKRKFGDLARPAADLAERGFEIDRVYAAKLRGAAAQLAQFPGSKAALLRPDGTPYAAGETLRQPDLARTYRALAEQGPDWFYKGEFAQRVSEWMAAHGGIITADDFRRYEVRRREPLVTRYRDHTIVGFPPPSSGGVHVAQMLQMLESFDLRGMKDRDESQAIHVIAESMKRAFADRAYWLGDPDFARVPRGLIDVAYAKRLAASIDGTRATKVDGHGTPPDADGRVFEKHTTHVTAVDRDGYWVALTTTVNTTFGSKVIVPGTGVVLNNEMDDFSLRPGVPNAFGLLGAEANAVAAGKRPLSSMSPTIVLRGDRPVMTVGAAGGPTIISQVLLAVIRRLDWRQTPAECLASPRWHQQWAPDELRVEESLSAAIRKQLEERGHRLRTTSQIGVSQAIFWDDETGEFVGVSDPRVPGKAGSP